VSRAGTDPFERSRAASRQNRSTSHGDEEEWEEAHDGQKEERGGSEDGRTQDREKESREEEDSRKEKASQASRGKEGTGPEERCAQAGKEGGAEACPETRGGNASRAEAGSPGACGATSGRSADGSAGQAGAVARHGEFDPAASRKPDGRRNAGAVRTASGNANVIAGF
jgi:hypothetical protein